MKYAKSLGLSVLLSSTVLAGCNSVIEEKVNESKQTATVATEEPVKEKEPANEEEWGSGKGYTSPETGYKTKEYYHDPIYLAAHITNLWYGYLTGFESTETFYEMYMPYVSDEYRERLPSQKESVLLMFEEMRKLYIESNRDVAQYYYSDLEWYGEEDNVTQQVFYRMFKNDDAESFYFKTTLVPKDDYWVIDEDIAIHGDANLNRKFYD